MQEATVTHVVTSDDGNTVLHEGTVEECIQAARTLIAGGHATELRVLTFTCTVECIVRKSVSVARPAKPAAAVRPAARKRKGTRRG